MENLSVELLTIKNYDEFVLYCDNHSKNLSSIVDGIMYNLLFPDDGPCDIRKILYLINCGVKFVYSPFLLTMAIKRQDCSLCKFLMSKKDIDYVGFISPLCLAAISGAIEILNYFINDCNMDVNEHGQYFTPLSASILFNQIESFEFLLLNGAYPQSALLSLLDATNNHIYYLSRLIDHGANVNIPISNNLTLSQLCLNKYPSSSRDELLSFLLNYSPPL